MKIGATPKGDPCCTSGVMACECEMGVAMPTMRAGKGVKPALAAVLAR